MLRQIQNQIQLLMTKEIDVKKLEDYQPGASRTLVLDALKKVSKSPKPSRKNGGQPAPTSS